MDKKKMKTLVGIFGGLAVFIACGFGWDAYDKARYRARSEQEMRDRAELVRNMNEENFGNAPNCLSIKRVLMDAEAALSRKDIESFKRRYGEYMLLEIKAMRNHESEDAREGLHEYCVRLLGKYVELQTPNWNELSEKQKMHVRINLVSELDGEVAIAYKKGEIK